MPKLDIREGMKVVVRGGFGRDLPSIVVVEDYEIEGKNGEDTISYTDKSGEGRWAYVSQVVRVVGQSS